MKSPSDDWEEMRREVLGLGDSSVHKTHYPNLRQRLVELERLRSKLQRSEAYLSEAQRLSHTGSFGWSHPKGEISWSDETFRIFEYDPGVKPTLDLVFQRMHPEDRARVRQNLERASQDGTDCEYEHRLLMPDNRVKWLHVLAHAVKDSSGNLEFLGAVIDVTERKRAEETLRRSEAYLAEAQRLTHTGSWAWSAVTHATLYWSEEMFRIFGLDPRQGLPTSPTFWERVHPEDRDSMYELLINAAHAKTDYEHEHRIVLPDGTVKHIHAIGSPLRDAGEVFEYVGTSVDVTERKRAEEKIREQKAELQRQNDRLQLLLNLTNRITSNLELREVLRAISANIREVMQCDAAGILLLDASGNLMVHALEAPQIKGFLKEELVISPAEASPAKRALDTLTPFIVNAADPDAFGREASEKALADGLRSHVFLPLVNRGRALGVLGIARKTDISFTAEDVEFLSQVSGQIAIAVENALAYREISELRDKLAQEKHYLEDEIRNEMGFDQIIGNSAALKHALELVQTVAPSDSTVLLLGETGTGKELIARATHDCSRRKDRTFVKLNCAAIPTGLLESELFGHERGAFTGAITQKLGRMELADQGTLFLDEVGDIPIEIQPKLLRVLQEREFERLGSTHTRKVNVRQVAATNRDLEKMIAAREFRSDLYYRLNVFPIRIPPLRERKEDIPLLVSYFVQKFAKQMQKKIEGIPAAAMKGLTAWEWPGNIRELENFIERAVILTRGKSLEAPLAELRKLNTDRPAHAPAPQGQEDIARIVKETINALHDKNSVADEHAKRQREEIVRALAESKGRVGGADGAAARIGVNRTTFLSRMKKFGIDPRQYA